MYLIDLPATELLLGCDHPCFGCPVRDVAVCNALSERELEQFRRRGSTRRLAQGEALCWQGEAATHVYSLTRGVLRLSKLLEDGRRQVTGFAFPGAFIGVTLENEHPFTAEAVSEVELCHFSRNRFDEFVEAHPQMERRLYSAAASELAVVRDQVVLLGRKTAAERIASFLLHMARHSQQNPSQPRRVALPMSRADIADYLGLRIETVSRELSALRASSLIRMTAVHELQILDVEGLERRAAD